MTRLFGMLVGLLSLVAHAASQAELKVQLGHSHDVESLAISPDGRRVVTGGDDCAILWDVATGREIRRFRDAEEVLNKVSAAAFSPDGRFVLTGSGKLALLWDAAAGKVIHRFEGHTNYVESVAFSADGRWIVTAGMDDTARLWDAESGREIRRFEGHNGTVPSVAISGDGRRALTGGSDDKSARLWDTGTGSEIRRFAGHGALISSVALSRDGEWGLTTDGVVVSRWSAATGQETRFEHSSGVNRIALSANDQLAAGYAERAIRIWDAATGKEIRQLEVDDLFLNAIALSADGRTVAAGISGNARLWDLATGVPVQRFEGHTGRQESVTITPDGRHVLAGRESDWQLWDLTAGGESHHFRQQFAALSPDGHSLFTADSFDRSGGIWDVNQGREIQRFEGLEPYVGLQLPAALFSPDARFVLTSRDDTAFLLDAQNGREVRQFKCSGFISSAAFSPDGRSLLLASSGVPRLLDVASGREIGLFDQAAAIERVAFSPDGNFVFMAALTGDTATLWDARARTEIGRLEGQFFSILAAAFSPDSRSLLTTSRDQVARLWDVHTGLEIGRLQGYSGLAQSATFSADGRFILTGSDDGTIKIWDSHTLQLLVTAISFTEGGWAVVDPEGRYDASDPDHSPALYWQLGDDIIELGQLKARFYTPNLLGRTLGFSGEPLPHVAGLNQLQPWPDIQVKEPQPGQTAATIRLTDRGGGIGRVVVKVNGREVPLSQRGTPIQSGREVPIDLSGAQLAAAGNNTIEVVAYGQANLVAGRGVTVQWKKAPENAAAPPVLHAIVAGVSTYENAAMSLRFPAKDALDMANALEVGGKRLFGVEHLDIARFATGTEHEPTKENLRQAFAAIRSNAGPNDVVLVYLAGHGVAGKAGSDLYYYLTREARSVNPDDDPQLWKDTTISSAELLEWLRQKGMPLRQVIVLDTCAAGAAVNSLVKLADRRELTADQRRALELLKDATGSHILMGAAADKVSYEASRYGQGLLTYSLLQGMRGEALDEGGRLDVANWFRTAQQEVPQLAQGIGGIQQPVISSPGGQTFPIAMFTPEDRKQIHLPGLKPQLLRARVEDEDQNDPLQLEEPIRALLRTISIPATRGEVRVDPPLVYLDQVAGDVAGAYVPQVRYRVGASGVEIRLRLVSGQNRVERNITAPSRDPAELSRRIVAELVQMAAAAKAQ